MLAHVTQLYEAQQKRKAKEEVIVVAMKEDVVSVQAEAYAKVMDDTIVHGVIIDLTNFDVMDETLEAPNATLADKVEHTF